MSSLRSKLGGYLVRGLSASVFCDLYAISSEPVDLDSLPDSEVIIRRAKTVYAEADIMGSDDKDVFAANVFCVSGAELDSSSESVSDGLVLVGSPTKKRLALSLVSLKVAACRAVSQELGSIWVSCPLYRRCAMARLNKLFGVAS